MAVTSLLVGIGTGLAAVVFNILIRWVTNASFTWVPNKLAWLGHWYILLVPMIGGLLAGPVIYLFAREARGHGVPEVMQAIALKGGRIRPQVAVVKAVASSITIGTGGSVGREGPIVQIGAALGSVLGQAFGLSTERIRTLVACGAAGGIAATFNAPIAGVIFAIEVILGELSISNIGSVVISAVAANTVMQLVVGGEYAFPVPRPYTLGSAWELVFYAVMGVLAALVAAFYVRTLYWTEDVFQKQKLFPEWVQPAVGGLLIGILALAYPLIFPALSYDQMPQVFGGGYPPISTALAGDIGLKVALGLMLLKIAATNLTLGSGGSGGVFAPGLFIGAMLGTAVGIITNMLFPGLNVQPGAFALVGMGAVFAGSAHAPITAVIMLFELTGDYKIILPLMLAVIIATVLARRMLGGESIYTLKLARRGIRLQRGRDVDVLQSVTVEEVMAHAVETVPPTMTLVEFSEVLSHSRQNGFPIVGEHGELLGIVAMSDLEGAVARNLPRTTPVLEFGTPASRTSLAYPDETMEEVLSRMGRRGLGRLPVVARDDPLHLLGTIRREEIIDAYNLAIARRAELQHRTKRIQLRNIDGTEFVDMILKKGDAAIGKRIVDLASSLPRECVLVSIRRNGKMLIPHGSTVLKEGDQITAFVDASAKDTLHTCLAGDAGHAPHLVPEVEG